MKKLIDKNTCSCFYCDKQFDKKESYKMTVEMAEGQADYDVCPECAKEFNVILQRIEDVKNEVQSDA